MRYIAEELTHAQKPSEIVAKLSAAAITRRYQNLRASPKPDVVQAGLLARGSSPSSAFPDLACQGPVACQRRICRRQLRAQLRICFAVETAWRNGFQRWTRVGSYYLASRQDDFDLPAPDEDWVDFTDVPYVIPADDNARTKDRLSAAAALCFVV